MDAAKQNNKEYKTKIVEQAGASCVNYFSIDTDLH